MDLPQPFHNFSGPIFQTSAFCGFRQARPLGQKKQAETLEQQPGRPIYPLVEAPLLGIKI